MAANDNGTSESPGRPTLDANATGQEKWVDYVISELSQWNSRQAEFKNEMFAELRGLREEYGEMRIDISTIKEKLVHFDPAVAVEQRVILTNLASCSKDLEGRVRKLESDQHTFSGKWGVIAAVGMIVCAAIVSLVFKLMEPSTPLPAQPAPSVIQQSAPSGVSSLSERMKLFPGTISLDAPPTSCAKI